MTTLQTIINRAFRELQIIDISTTPSAAQSAEALPILQGIITRNIRPPVITCWLGLVQGLRDEKGGEFRDFTNFADVYALPHDVYLNCALNEADTINLSPAPGDGARVVILDYAKNFATFNLTIQGNGNTIDGAQSTVLSTNGQTLSLFYRRDLADWQTVQSLGLSQNLPFPEEFDDMFVIELAMRINPRYGNDMNELTVQMFQQMKSRFKSRYLQVNSSVAPDRLWNPRRNSRNPVTVGNLGIGIY